MTVRSAVSVVVPSFRSAGTIRECLAGVLAQRTSERIDVVVADSGDDGTAEIVRSEFGGVRLLHSSSRLAAEAARNWGASEAGGAILAFIDSDCVPEPDWLDRLTAPIRNGECDGNGGAVRPLDGSNAAAWAGYFCEFREFLPGGVAAEATYLTPGNAAYRADTFHRAGGFAVGYYPMEDQVFYERLRVVGARLRFDPSVVVKHAHRDKVSEFLVHQVRIGNANARVVTELGLRGHTIARQLWLAAALLPALATYRFCRTVATCWREERYLLIRRPWVTALCFVGMWSWGLGFAGAGSRRSTASRQSVT